MKNNTSILVLLTFLFLCSTATIAQELPGISFGILAGPNFQNLNGKSANGEKLANDMILGYHAGVNVQIPIVTEFFFQPGLSFATKGASNKYLSTTTTYNISYLEMPLNFVYKGALGNGFVMVGFGPYFGYGIGGKVTSESEQGNTKSDIVFQNTVEITDPLTDPYLRPMDVGANILAGYEMMNGVFFQIETQFGVMDINAEYKGVEGDQSSLKNTGFGVSLGYRF